MSCARTCQSQGNEQGLKAPEVDYGQNLSESFAWYDQATSLWRTYQACLEMEWVEFSETWPRAGMMRNGIAYRRQPLVPLTGGTGCSLWPTLTARDYRHSGSKAGYEKRKGKHVNALNEEVCWGARGIQVGGQLNPTWGEWLMGFPKDFTEVGIDDKLGSTQEGTESIPNQAMRKVQLNEANSETPSQPRQTTGSRDALPEVSCDSGSAGRDATCAANTNLCDLWAEVPANRFPHTQNLRTSVFERIGETTSLQEMASHWTRGEWPDIPRVATGVPRRVDRLRCLGNAVVPQVAEFIGQRIRRFDGRQGTPA